MMPWSTRTLSGQLSPKWIVTFRRISLFLAENTDIPVFIHHGIGRARGIHGKVRYTSLYDKRKVECCTLNDHGNLIIDHGIIMEKSWLLFLMYFLWEPCIVDFRQNSFTRKYLMKMACWTLYEPSRGRNPSIQYKLKNLSKRYLGFWMSLWIVYVCHSRSVWSGSTLFAYRNFY